MSMTWGQIAEITTVAAKEYRNGPLLQNIVPNLSGAVIDESAVRAVLEPYLESLAGKLPPDIMEMERERLNALAPRAMDQVRLDQHMNNASGDTMTQDNADAILVCFVNLACMPVDLAFYTRDLVD